jgi:hypothetical protein
VGVVLLFIVAADAYVMFGIAPVYESKTQFVLVNPPAAPTEVEIKANPALGLLNTNNPYLRLPNPSVVADVLAQRVGGESVRRDLVAAGADEDYEIAPTNALGSGLVIEITGTGASAAQCRRTLELVSERMKNDLRDMQKVNGADDRFLIQALPITPPTEPQRKVTSTVRSLVAVTAAGLVLLFAFVSVAEALGPRRTGRRATDQPKRTLESELTMVLPRLYIGGHQKEAEATDEPVVKE